MKIPYTLIPAVKLDQRHRHMQIAVNLGYPRLGHTPIDETASLSIACYGPSLVDTWMYLKPPILSVSGALHFLAARGIVPDYHVQMDPRADNTPYVDPPIPGVHYLMASVCHPSIWSILRGHNVTIWHPASDKCKTLDWLTQHDLGQPMVLGGSHVGLAALHIGGMLGARHFEIHGMDASIRDGQRHAGKHYGHKQGGITWDAGGVTWQTSKIMANGAVDTINTLEHCPIFCVFHGRGLQQELVREAKLDTACCADEIAKAAFVRRAKPIFYPLEEVRHDSTESVYRVRSEAAGGVPSGRALGLETRECAGSDHAPATQPVAAAPLRLDPIHLQPVSRPVPIGV